MKLLATLAGTALLALPLSAPLAQDRGSGACRADVERLCPDASERRAVFQCLRDRQDEVSDACKKQLAEARQRPGGGRGGMRRALQACRGDLDQHCGEVERGGGRLGTCLREHADELSEQCRDALQGMQR